MTSRFFTGKHLAEQIRPLLRCSARARALSPIVLLVAATGALMPLRAAGAFGLTEDGKDLVVDSGAGLVFRVVKTTGDIASIRQRPGPELQEPNRRSQIASGLGRTTKVAGTVLGGNIAKITISTAESNRVPGLSRTT